MKLMEFKKLINNTEKILLINSYGICCAFDSVCLFNYRIDEASLKRQLRLLYNKSSKYSYYFGKPGSNKPLRLVALRLFEQYCITEGIYKEF